MKKNLFRRIIAIAVFVLILVSTNATYLLALTQEEIDAKLGYAEGQKDNIEDKLDSLAGKKTQASKKADQKAKEIAELEKQIKNGVSEKEIIMKDIEHMYEMILNMENTINETQNEYDKKEALFKERAKVMYQYSEYSFLDILLESENILDFINRVGIMTDLLKNDNALIEELETLKLDLTHKKEMQKVACANQEEILAEKENILNKISKSQKIAESDYQASRKELSALLAEEDKLLQKSKEIENTIKWLQEESKRLKYEGGVMRWPAEKGTYISSYYGMRMHPIYKVMRMHNGIDIPAAGGTNILAANTGTVIVAAWDSGYGNYIIIDHGGGITTVYAHSSKLVAKRGDEVKKGQVIAKVGTTGTSTGNHLHFEVRVNGATVNPLNYVKFP